MQTALETIKRRREAKKSSDTAASTTAAAVVELNYFKVKKDGNDNIKAVEILQTGFVALLRRLGFRKFEVGEGYIIVRVTDNVIEPVQLHQLRGYIIKYFHRLDEDVLEEHGCPKDLLLERLHRTLETLTSESKLALLFDIDEQEKIEIVQDTVDKAYFFYRNGFVEVTKEGRELKPYKDLPGYVWKDQILQRDFEKLAWTEWEKGMYFQFANNIADNYPHPETCKPNNPDRFASFMTVTGYCLHKFFNTALHMPIFMDARLGDEAEGRSGKSLHCKAMRHMLNADPENGRQCIVLDGKNFDPDNRFKYEDLDISTRLFVLDDVRKGLDIQLFYNSILDGFMRERKGDKTKVRIWTKVILTLNYSLNVKGGSSKDRVVEFELADFYSATKKPQDVHGCYFFRDWDAQEWARFDNFMLQCVSEYLRTGIIQPDTINLEARKLLEETAPEFIAWMEDLEIEHEKDYDKYDLFNKFAKLDEHTGKPTLSGFHWLKQRTFTDWLHDWARYRPEMAGYREWRSSGKDMIRFFYNDAVSPASLDTAGKSVKLKLFDGKSDKVKPLTTPGASEQDLPF